MRGLKSKIDALDEATDGYKSSIIGWLETHLAKEEHFEIPGIHINDGKKNSKGIPAAVTPLKPYQ